MSSCRLHVFLPDEPESATSDKREDIRAAFEEHFTPCEGVALQDSTNELVSEIFDDTDENLERIDAFETAVEDIYPDADILRTRQDRSVMGGDADYDEAIMLQITHALV